jgi:hypothetical protein
LRSFAVVVKEPGARRAPGTRAGHESPPLGADGPGPGGAADGDVRILKGRLVALEHVLGAVGALLEAGAVEEAISLVRGWRRRG